MSQSAADFAEHLLKPLERADSDALWDLSRNLKAHLQNTLQYVEQTSEVMHSAQLVFEAVQRLIQHTPSHGDFFLVRDMPRDIHQDALEKAKNFHADVLAAPPSGKARALFGG